MRTQATIVVTDDKTLADRLRSVAASAYSPRTLRVVPGLHPNIVMDAIREMGTSGVDLRIVVDYGHRQRDAEWLREQQELAYFLDRYFLKAYKDRGLSVTFYSWPGDHNELLDRVRASTAESPDEGSVVTDRVFEESGAEEGLLEPVTMARSEGRVVTGYSDLRAALIDAPFAPIAGIHIVTFLVLALSMLSFGVGLFLFGGSYFGAGLTFGGAILAYEAVYVFLRREREE